MKVIIHSVLFFSAVVLFSGNAQAQFEIDQNELHTSVEQEENDAAYSDVLPDDERDDSNFALQSKFQSLTCGSYFSHSRNFCPAPAGYLISSVRVVHLSHECKKRPSLMKWNWNYRGITTNDGCVVRLHAFLKPAR